ncbi:MAG: L,D-transpeptidase [Thermomicrobiales bacterium]
MSDLNCVFQSRLSRIAIAVLVLSTTLLSVDLSRTSDTTEAASFVDWNSPRVYFPDSGQAIGGAFLQKWAFDLKDLDLGSPVTPAVEIEGAVVQWLEYGRLEYRGESIETATADAVVRAPIGRLYAERMGYTRWVPAFKPIDAAGTESRYFYETRHAISNDFLRIYEQRGNEERLGAPISEEFDIGRVNYQFFEYGAMAWDNVNGTRVIPLGRLDASLYGLGNAADDYAPGDVYYSSASMLDLSDAFPGERWIEIDLTEHEIIAWVGDFELMRTEAVTGPIQSPTPTGTFAIYLKYEIQNLSGIGWNGQPYSAPGTPWVMYFHLDYAVHGSTWRTTYGFGSGQGCVIPPNEAAEKLWKWADYGTKVWVHY